MDNDNPHAIPQPPSEATETAETSLPPATVFYVAPGAEESDTPSEASPVTEDPAIIRLESESPAPDPQEWAEERQAAEADVPSPAPEVQPAPATGGVSNDLEEEVYAPSLPVQGPQVGQQVGNWHLQSDLGRGWFMATEGEGGEAQMVYVRPDPAWAALLAHRLLPHTEERGGVQVVEAVEGQPVRPDPAHPLALGDAAAHLTELARLLFALEKQGYALTDLDPAQLVWTEGGLKLRQPPRVVRLGESDPAALRDGLTAPEVMAGQPAGATAGVYLLGAMLYGWLTGQTPPPGGPSTIELASLKTPGLPQLLAGMLAPAPARTTPAELLSALKRLNPAPLPTYRVVARTSVGLNPDRPANEDAYGYQQQQVASDQADVLRLRACVSDGMGGMAAGEVASQAAVQAFLASDKPDLPGMVWDANAAVLEAMNGRDGGCTISGVDIVGTTMQLGHVGDTRAYVRLDGEVSQISKDHSFVAAMVASGQMTPEEAQVSPERNKVLRSLGSLRQPQPDYVQTLPEPLTLAVGSRVLLVSDGVWGEVEPATLTELLQSADLQDLVDRLVQLSLDAGAPDNVTALAIERLS